jgi:CRP-like cAMP-binding protein
VDDFDDKTPLVRVELKRVDLSEYVRGDVRLRGCGILRELGEDAVTELLKTAMLRRFSPRTVLFDQADRGDSLFWVLKGEAWLAMRTAKELVDLGPVQRGEVFGEAEALGEADSRAWLVRASGELDVAEFPREAVQAVGAHSPSILNNLREVRARRQATQAEMLAFYNKW